MDLAAFLSELFAQTQRERPTIAHHVARDIIHYVSRHPRADMEQVLEYLCTQSVTYNREAAELRRQHLSPRYQTLIQDIYPEGTDPVTFQAYANEYDRLALFMLEKPVPACMAHSYAMRIAKQTRQCRRRKRKSGTRSRHRSTAGHFA